LKLAKILGCEVICTTQYAKALGPIDPAIDLASLGSLHLGTFDKTDFSMFIPEVAAILQARPLINSLVLFGIEVVARSYISRTLTVIYRAGTYMHLAISALGPEPPLSI